MKKQDWKKSMEKLWKRTKKDLEKVLDDTTSLLKKGEVYFKELSAKSKDKLDLLALKVRREKLYYRLGKALANVPKTRWINNNKIDKLLSEIRSLNRKIRQIQK